MTVGSVQTSVGLLTEVENGGPGARLVDVAGIEAADNRALICSSVQD